MNLDIENWKEFRVGDLFKLQRGHTLTVEQKEEFVGAVPCVNGTIENNGVQCYLSKDIESVGFNLVKSPAISIVRVGNGGKTFVQTEDFYVADNAFALLPLQNMPIGSMMFISTLLDREQIKYSYGRTVTNEYEDTIIKLPVGLDGAPDWQFMENYTKSLHYELLTTKNEKGQVHDLDVRDWGEFKVGDLFAIERGQRLIADDREEGNIAYFSASQDNNGCTDHISNPLFIRRDSLIYDTFGDCYYVSGEFTASDEISILSHDRLNPYNGLFIATIMMANKYKYAFGRKAFQNKFVDNCIKLPVDTDGNPDWQFMEDYIKALPYGDRLVV